MGVNESVDINQINESLSSLDKWIDAIKDISLVSIGIIASFLSLIYGGSIEISLIMIILAVSILSGMFLPYKIAVTKKEIHGVFSRYRAIEIMGVILISWIIPTSLIVLVPETSIYLLPQSDSRMIRNLLTFILPYGAVLITMIITAYGRDGTLKRTGIPNEVLEKYKKYTWGLDLLSLWLVSYVVINLQLLLLEAILTFSQSSDLAILLCARVFGSLIVLILFACILSYFEPKRIRTNKGTVILGTIGFGLLFSLNEPLFGFLLSFSGLLIIIPYTLSIPKTDYEKIIGQKDFQNTIDKIESILMKLKYGRRAILLSRLTAIFAITTFFGFFVFGVFGFEIGYSWLIYLIGICMVGWVIFQYIESTLENRLRKRFIESVLRLIEEGKLDTNIEDESSKEILLGLIREIIFPAKFEDRLPLKL